MLSRYELPMNFHRLRFGPIDKFLLGNGSLGVGKMYSRRATNTMKTTMPSSLLRCHLGLLGSVKYGTVHADRGPFSPTFCGLYSAVKVVMLGRKLSK